VFTALSDARFPVERVLVAIAAAAGAGLPVKVNMVVKRGGNEQSILPMAAHFRGTGRVLRFIEYMDVGTTNGWRLDDVVPAAEIISLIGSQWPPRRPSGPLRTATRRRGRSGFRTAVLPGTRRRYRRDPAHPVVREPVVPSTQGAGLN
jgi:GTP 3',8-cyclase